jgi:hypothetical protein
VASGGEGLSPVEGDGVVVLALVRVVADALLGETEAAMTQFDGRGGLCRFNGREHFFAPNLVQWRVPNAKFHATVGFRRSGRCLRKAREHASGGRTGYFTVSWALSPRA